MPNTSQSFWIFTTRNNRGISIENIQETLWDIERDKQPHVDITCFNTYEQAKAVVQQIFTPTFKQGGPSLGFIMQFSCNPEELQDLVAHKNKSAVQALQIELAAEFKRGKKDDDKMETKRFLNSPVKEKKIVITSSINTSEKAVLKPILSGKKMTEIPYMDKPPAQGGKLSWLSPEEFSGKFNCEFFEGIMANAQYPTIDPNTIKDRLLLAAYERLQNPLEGLVICDMGGIGHGLFTLKHIPRGTVIGVYTGEYDPKSNDNLYDCGHVTAAKIGGFSRFMQHLPISSLTRFCFLLAMATDPSIYARHFNVTDTEAQRKIQDKEYIDGLVSEYEFSVRMSKMDPVRAPDWDSIEFLRGTVKHKSIDRHVKTTWEISPGNTLEISDSNVIYEPITIGNITLNVMCAMRDIAENEPVGFSYGRYYWQNPKVNHPPVLITKTGEIIPAAGNFVYPGFAQAPAPANRDSLAKKF